jgi:hypothetical protein
MFGSLNFMTLTCNYFSWICFFVLLMYLNRNDKHLLYLLFLMHLLVPPGFIFQKAKKSI